MAIPGRQSVPRSPNGKEVFVPANRSEWREWLQLHPHRAEGLWVVYPTKSSGLEGPTYDDVVEEALCFGWIDSVTHSAGDGRQLQWFSPRRRGGIWSRLNKDRILRLVGNGLMTERGLAVIDAAKADGSWSQYDDVDAMVIQPDLMEELARAPVSKAAFEALSPSVKKQQLWWIYSAKRPATRASRITQLIQRLAAGE